MANAKDSAATRAIPSAGPDFEHLLAQEVVIEAGYSAPTGAQSIAPDHSPRAPAGTVDTAAHALPKAGMVVAGLIRLESTILRRNWPADNLPPIPFRSGARSP